MVNHNKIFVCPCVNKPNKNWYQDLDGDGYHSATKSYYKSPGTGWKTTTLGVDCDDGNVNVHKNNKCGKCEPEPQTLEEVTRNQQYFDAALGILGGITEVVAGVLSAPSGLGTFLIIDGSYRIIAGISQVLLVSADSGDDVPRNLGEVAGVFVDYAVSGNASDELQTAFGYANDGFVFVATGGTGGIIAGTIQGFSKGGNALEGASSLVNAGLFVNELNTLQELKEERDNLCE